MALRQSVQIELIRKVVSICYIVWVTNKTKVENGTLDVRAYPSAGALYPIEVYVVANNVEYLKKGVYHHNVGIV